MLKLKDYLHEIPKETLTIKNIKHDIKKMHETSIAASLFLVAFGFVFALIANALWKNATYGELKIYAVFFGVFGVFVILSGISILFLPFIGRKITNKKLVIVEDWLVDIREVSEYYGRRRRSYYMFYFANGGKYKLYPGYYNNDNYTWSKMYNMSNQGIYNYSQINDDFYLVFSNEKKNNLLLIYNKKLFELK